MRQTPCIYHNRIDLRSLGRQGLEIGRGGGGARGGSVRGDGRGGGVLVSVGGVAGVDLVEDGAFVVGLEGG